MITPAACEHWEVLGGLCTVHILPLESSSESQNQVPEVLSTYAYDWNR